MKLLNPLWAKVCYGLALFMFVAAGATAQDGCTTAGNGQYPSDPYTPACEGEEESITTFAYAGEYSVVNVVSGESYVFSSDISTDYLTISSNESSPTVYVSGVTPVSWDATFDGEVRFYTHTDSDCGESTSFRDRNIQCGEITYDCPQLEVNIGDPCDDGDPNTANDAYNESCECVGEAVVSGQVCEDPLVVSSLPYSTSDNTSNYVDDYDGGDVPAVADDAVTNGTGSTSYLTGDDAVYSYTPSTDMAIDISLANITSSGWVSLWVFTGCPFNSTVGYHTSTSSDDRLIPALPVTAGTTYYIVISSWPSPQSTPYDLTIEETTFDCPELEANIGDDCDDGDSGTFDDVVTDECDCVGTPYECPSLMANIGDDCDDGDETTFDDVVTEECECAGTPFDCPDELANVGDECDDEDPNTSFDQYNENCECAGFLPAENDDCVDATALTLDAAPITASNIGATADGPAMDCAFIGDAVQNDVWFTFVAPEDGEIVIETFETVEGNENDDTQVQILDACDGNVIACNEDGGDGLMSRILLECGDYTPGATLYVQVDGYNSAEGPFDISVTTGPCFDCPDLEADIGESCDDGDPNTSMDTVTENCECVGAPVPSNDVPCAAAQISCGSENAITDVLDGATTLPDFPACDGSSDALGRWYRFTTTGNFDLTIMETGDDNIDVQVFSGACNDLTEVECTTFGEDEIELGVLPSGVYYVHLFADPDVDFEDANDFTVELMCTDVGCSSPTIETSYVDSEGNPIVDCQEIGEQYFVEVSFTGGSGNTSYQVSVDGGDAVEVDADGSESFGPFDAIDAVDVVATGTQIDVCEAEVTVPGNLCPPDNDLCEDATEIVLDAEPITLDNTGGTPNGPEMDCAFSSDELQNVVWASFVAPADAEVTIETFDIEGNDDTQFNVLDACDGEVLACSEDDGDGLMSLFTFECGELTAGETYYIQIDGYNGLQGPFDISVTTNPCFDCPELEADIGDSCDDGDPNTSNDVVTAACECEGILTDATVDCGNTVSATYCYDNNDETTFQYTSSNGDALNLSFLEGGIESCCDDIIVYDGNSTEDPVLYQGNNGGDLSGLSINSTGDQILLTIDSDGSISCASGSTCCGTSWSWEVSCGADFDCPELEANIGDSCDDGDPNTIEDTVTENCECLGVVPPENDNCEDAIALSCDQTVTGTTVGATPDTEECGGADGGNGVWYTLTLAEEKIVTLETCLAGTDFDSDLSVFTGPCDDLTCFSGFGTSFNDGYQDGTQDEIGDCGGDFPLNFRSGGIFTAEAGVTYHILLSGYSEDDAGNFELQVSCESPGTNVDITTDLACEKDLTVKLYEPGTANLVEEYAGTSDANGDFSILVVTPGEYDVYVHVNGFLQKVQSGADISGAEATVEFTDLIPGDVDGDNSVGPLDLSLLTSAYLSSSGSGSYNDNADLDCSENIGPLDLSLLTSNYLQSGDVPPEE